MNINMEQYIPSERHKKNFSTLLYDSIYLLYLACDLNFDDFKDDIIHTCARSSALSSLLIAECAANCLIHSLELSASLYIEIEKLPTLAKFEFFLSQRFPKKGFDYGFKQVAAIKELLKLRNEYVHPKVEREKYEKIGEGTWAADYGNTKILKIPYDIDIWQIKHSIFALKSVMDFLNLFLLDWCKMETSEIINILLIDEKVDVKGDWVAVDGIGSLDRAMHKWNLNFDFIGKKLSPKPESYANSETITLVVGHHDDEILSSPDINSSIQNLLSSETNPKENG